MHSLCTYNKAERGVLFQNALCVLPTQHRECAREQPKPGGENVEGIDEEEATQPALRSGAVDGW